MKGAAWNALIASYPEASQVRIDDLEGFIASIGFAMDQGKLIPSVEKQKLDEERAAKERERHIYTDPQTGLQWARNGNIPGIKMQWEEAMRWAKNLNYAGYNDWRLPTDNELRTVLNRGGNSPAEWLNANGFRNVQDDIYWSSQIKVDTNEIWIV
jgi:hypothetical protein